MQDPSVTDKEREDSRNILKKETDYLISEIERLESQRSMQQMRLKNVTDLVRFIEFHRLSLPTIPIQAFATVNIEDSRNMKELTIATVRDSAAMKQVCANLLYELHLTDNKFRFHILQWFSYLPTSCL